MESRTNNRYWQLGLQHINQRAGMLLELEQYSDCSFVVGTDSEKQTFKSHRLILTMASPVFAAMFFGSLAAKKDEIIKIDDIYPQAFKELLRYIYTDEINFNSFDEACNICYAANKYMIPHLVEKCVKYMEKHFNPSNVCEAYELIQLIEMPQIREKCLALEKCMSIIRMKTKEVLLEESFEEVNIKTLKVILDQEMLNVDEADLWKVTLNWSEQECVRQSLEINPANQRNVMQELLPLIRFLTLSQEEFVCGPALSNILSAEESLNLLMNISVPGVTPIISNFSTRKERHKPLHQLCFHRYQIEVPRRSPSNNLHQSSVQRIPLYQRYTLDYRTEENHRGF